MAALTQQHVCRVVTIERALIDHGAGRLVSGGNSLARMGALALLGSLEAAAFRAENC